ncbi:MAG: hypothetical protein ACJ761_01210 [Chloroflexota bacterium]
MDARRDAPCPPDPDAVEFVRFCYGRRRVGWPELYDEMCAVANRGLFRGLGVDELSAIGIRLSLFELASLSTLACQIVAEDQARRRAIAVRPVASPEAEPVDSAVEPSRRFATVPAGA